MSTGRSRDTGIRYSPETMTPVRLIDWAVGILMAQTPCTPERAFDMLRTASQRSNVKLRDIAAQIVERTLQRSQADGQRSGSAGS
jgi:hypothetical protein